jgi:hypothetical protein
MLGAIGSADIVFCTEGVVTVAVGLALRHDVGIVCQAFRRKLRSGGFTGFDLGAGVGGEKEGIVGGGADA